jgi:lipoprotein NlpI
MKPFPRLLATLVLFVTASAAPAPAPSLREAEELFLTNRVEESLVAFDRLAADAEAMPYLWQRGIAQYYAGKFAEGRAQFEAHRKVNPNDVENAAWHFLCVARADGVEAARRALLPVGPDARVPMREVLDLFAGKGTEADVLRAANTREGLLLRNQLCYAHLYLGLYAEAAGDAAAARKHLTLAARDFAMDHYMGRVAQVHLKQRGWDTP